MLKFLEEYLGHTIAIAISAIDTPIIDRWDLLVAEYRIHGIGAPAPQHSGKVIGIGHAEDARSIALMSARRWIDAQSGAYPQ